MSNARKANFSLEAMDKLNLFHPVTSIADLEREGPVIYSHAKGARLRDQHDHDLIDLGAGLWCDASVALIRTAHASAGTDLRFAATRALAEAISARSQDE
jgi:L-2,4-diaminobutyrate transaminase